MIKLIVSNRCVIFVYRVLNMKFFEKWKLKIIYNE